MTGKRIEFKGTNASKYLNNINNNLLYRLIIQIMF